MEEEHLRFLQMLGQPPARLTAEQTAYVLNCKAHDIPALISARLLKPLGKPAQNGTKYFATTDVLECLKDRPWLVRMTTTINEHWQRNNARNRGRGANGARNGQDTFAVESGAVRG